MKAWSPARAAGLSTTTRRTVLGIGLTALAAAAPAAAQRDERASRPIRVGVLTDMSGPFAADTGPGSVAAARLAAEEFGDITGRKVEVLVADHGDKPDLGSAIARRWYDAEGVDAITDIVPSGVALAVIEVARARNRIALVTGASSSEITGIGCGPTVFHWTLDTFALARGTVRGVAEQGGRQWFFITADYAYGHALQHDATAELTRAGGRVVGSVLVPPDAADFGSYLLQARQSGAQVVALANAAGTKTALKQAHEFGIGVSGDAVTVVPMLLTLNDARAVGPEVVQGARSVVDFYWDRTPETRAWSNRFFDRTRVMPTDKQAGTYSSVRHFLQAVKDAGTTDALAVASVMRATPVRDVFTDHGIVRADGRMVHDVILLRAKTPEKSRGEWDLFEVDAILPGDSVFRPLDEGGCRLATAKQD